MKSRTPPKPVHVIREPRQLRALRTPTRHRVLNAIAELGPCSVAEIAHRLEWTAESLYYHVKALRDAGLVRRDGQRGEGRQAEHLYRTVASEIVLDQRNRTAPYLAAVWDVYRSALRASERDLERALQAERDGRGPRRKAYLHQLNVRMSADDAERLRAMLEEVWEFVQQNEAHDGAESVSLTTVVSRLARPER